MDEFTGTGGASTKTFVSHMMDFEKGTQHELMNLLQYTLVVIIPLLLLKHGIKFFSTDLTEDKPSLEIVTEVLLQTSLILFGLFMIHRLVTFIPTYSGKNYDDLTLLGMVLPIFFIMISFQTKLGDKLSLLMERALNYFGIDYIDEDLDLETKVKVNQPIENTNQNRPEMIPNKETFNTGMVPPPQPQQQVPPQLPTPPQQQPVQNTQPVQGGFQGGMTAEPFQLGGSSLGGSFF